MSTLHMSMNTRMSSASLEIEDLTLEESIESERLRRERDEEELQQIIDQNVHEVELAKLQKEKEERQEERERKKKQKP